MNAELAVELVLGLATAALAVFLAVGATIVLARRSATFAHVLVARAPAYARRMGLLTIAGSTLALAPAATASVADPPPATLTLDDSAPVAALSLGDTSPNSTPNPSPTPHANPLEVPSIPIGVASYTVVAGDNFWSIATGVIASHRTATPSEIGPYWLRLIAANADRLIERGNPNLIRPGQELIIPEP
jgi:nucleoid-associated protein YgaU